MGQLYRHDFIFSGYLYSLPVACVEEMTSSLTNEAMTHILLHAVLMAGFDQKFSINNQNKCFQNFKTLTLRWFIYRVTYNCLDWAKYQNRHRSNSI